MKDIDIKLSEILADKIGKKFCFLEQSGTRALTVSLLSLSLPEGSEVIIPSLCCKHVLKGVLDAGLTPAFSDVSDSDFNSHVDDIERSITDKVRAIVLVHLYGYPACPDAVLSLARKKSLYLIEDFSQAFGGYYKNKPLGWHGDISFTSFGYEKIIDCGGGGAIFTDNEDLAARTKEIQNQPGNGLDTRKWLDNLDYLLPDIDSNILKRRENAKSFHKMLDESLIVKPYYNLNDGAIWRYSCLLGPGITNAPEKREELIEYMRKNGFRISAHYSPPLHAINKTSAALPKTDYISSRVINFFVKLGVEHKEVIKTSAEINKFLGSLSA